MVRHLATSLLVSVAVLASNAAPAPSECYNIRDADLKNYCLATTTQRESYCFSVKNEDKKNFCLAQVRQKTSSCYSILDHDLKQLCLAWVREAQ